MINLQITCYLINKNTMNCRTSNKKEKNSVEFLKFECSFNTVYSN
jgi:hypothetical protein